MIWLSRLSFMQALRWASAWPIAMLTAGAVVWYAAMASGAVVSVRLEPAGPLPLWLALTLVASVALCGVGCVVRPPRRLSRRMETVAALSSSWPLLNVRWSWRAILGSGYAAMVILRPQLNSRR